jgi:hypothetical protein
VSDKIAALAAEVGLALPMTDVVGLSSSKTEGTMKYWKKFKSHKERGEWVELQFMAAAAQRCFAVRKPWGDTKPYDVGIEHAGNYLRVQSLP